MPLCAKSRANNEGRGNTGWSCWEEHCYTDIEEMQCGEAQTNWTFPKWHQVNAFLDNGSDDEEDNISDTDNNSNSDNTTNDDNNDGDDNGDDDGSDGSPFSFEADESEEEEENGSAGSSDHDNWFTPRKN